MLRCGILSLIRSSSIQSSRFYRDRKTYAGDQAGFRRQSSELGDAELFQQDPEGDYEADFNAVPSTWRDHEREMQRRKENVKLKIIERKYFRAKKQPSFLTWAEKEQIRHLNQQDPDEWTVDRLAESFPATEDTIVKILQAKWTPNNMKRVREHDENIKKNWQAFKANKFENLDPELKEHLAKFSQRKFDSSKNAYVLSKNDQIEFKFPKPKNKEFSHIILTCKPLMKAKELGESRTDLIAEDEKENSVMISEMSMKPNVELAKRLRSRSMTYEELQKNLGIEEKNPDEDDFHISFEREPNSKTALDQKRNNSFAVDELEEIDLNFTQYTEQSSEVNMNAKNHAEIESVSNQDDANASTNSTLVPKIQQYVGKQVTILDDVETVADKIEIPRGVMKKGAMYRVHDCFYDDNGDFLFRVPGLIV